MNNQADGIIRSQVTCKGHPPKDVNSKRDWRSIPTRWIQEGGNAFFFLEGAPPFVERIICRKEFGRRTRPAEVV
eukprot:11201776-Lingulodinium_polyedra.AAC.1